MIDQTVWHEDDEFWTSFRPYMFDENRWEAAVEDIDKVLALTQIGEGSAVIDLGCGPGRHSLELARRGYDVVGVDRTSPFLEEAAGRARKENLNIEFLLEDIRSFVRPGCFDLALSLFTSFGYFEDGEDNQHVLDNSYKSLKYGGSLVLEMMGKEILARIFLERDWYRVGDTYVLQERKVIADWTRVWNRWILITETDRREFNVVHWIYSAAELMKMLEQSGFKDIQLLGDLTGSPYDGQASKLVAVAKK